MDELAEEGVPALFLTHRGTHQVGSVHFRLLERIHLPIRIDSKRVALPFFRDCLVDTGCPLPLLFPRIVWQLFEPAIVWIGPELEIALPEHLRHSQGAAGGRIEYRIGSVFISLCDTRYQAVTPRKPRLAAFAQTDTMVGEPLIGLGGGILNEFALYLNLYLQRAELRS